MDHNKARKARETVVDIESSESECEEDRRNERNKRAKTLLRNLGGNINFQGSEGECSSNSYKNSVQSSSDEYEDIESLTYPKFGGIGEHTPLIETLEPKDKHKNLKPKKAPKPPRPRKGPSLDTSDLQLVKEIAEQTMKRRARAERLKALKKRRAAMSSLSLPPPPPSSSSLPSSSSSSSSNSSLFALGITVLFFLVIIFQGFGSGQSSTLSFDDSPKPSGAPLSGLISIQLGNNMLENNQQFAKPPKKFARRKIFNTNSSFVEQKSGSESSTSVK